MSDSLHAFAGDFPAADLDAWRAEADKALKGAPFERLIRTTVDGIERGPLFTRADLADAGDSGAPGAAPFIRGGFAERDEFLPWGVRQTVDHPDPKAANAHILEELSGGASEIALKLDPLGETGVAARTLEELKIVLDGVMLDLAPVHLQPSRMAPQSAALFLALLEQSGLDPKTIRGGLGLSPIGQKSLAGGGAASLEERLQRTAEAAAYAAEAVPGVKTVAITATAPHEAGGSEAQEIAFACAGGASYMRAFIDSGLSPDQAANALEFSFAADADIHLTIAKLRAARRAWARVAEAFGVSEDKRAMQLHAVTSARMLTARDPYTNLIRNACAGLAAAAGGADSLTVRPFTEALGPATPFARRMARNLQILLMEESHLGKTADPAGGGYLHETLGARIAEAGWAVFQEIERRGGLFSTVRSGWLQGEIAKSLDARRQALAKGKDALIGVSHFPQLDAKAVETETRIYAAPKLDAPVIEPQPFAGKVEAARSGAQVRVLDLPEPEWTPVSPVRLAEPFEALRARAEAFMATNGDRPKAFLATLGPLADFNARATFAANRLAVAGVEAMAPDAYETLEDCVAAFGASGATLAVICGTDEAYAEQGEALARLIRIGGEVEVWIAGKPSETAGVDHFIHMRSDALDDGARALQAVGA
ncbi:MAG: methylmalonyl-CoA mutase family protein [Alphaproteobacteria bacterium]|nr:methylmalonyl-CoA mutase family protein [Alphaproteobacteria bacterium]